MTPTPPRDRLAEIERALEPFAAVSAEAKGSDDACWCGQNSAVIRYRDLRAASAALTTLAEMRADMEGLAELSARATPGPWKDCPSREFDFFCIYPNTGRAEFPIAKMPDFIKADVNGANAQLIARSVNIIRKWIGETA